MAAMHVPPPPEYIDEEFDFLSQQTFSSTQSQRKPSTISDFHFGGSGFALPTNTSTYGLVSARNTAHMHSLPSSNDLERTIQRVPETPAWQAPQVPCSVDYRLDFSFDAGGGREHIGLRSVSEVPREYQNIFKKFSHFNYVQSKVFDDVMYTDSSLVTSAPTGSGKTVIFELAIVRLLMHSSGGRDAGKIIYVAPIKALCSERFKDWQVKFEPLGLRCCELTGDSQLDDYFELQNAQIIMTTPEKWDSMTRRWRDYKSLVQLVGLFLIDEVHQLNDVTRGPTMEAIVSRMKTIQSSMAWEGAGGKTTRSRLRIIAVSATIPNISDVAAWLGTTDAPALEFSIDESHRPVRLRRVVLGYPDAATEFKFDLSLNYRLGGVIQLYSEQKPTLVFCATRKGTQQAAGVLVKEARFVMNIQHKQRLQQVASSLRESKLREFVLYGVGYHHAGLDSADRKAIETMFTTGDLPVLFATSTLAMGVNLPAHLVVIKSTMHYIAGMFQECSESQILQMIGRAGRPQFDTTATAVILTRNSTKAKYEALVSGNQLIESSLHHNLIEHLNAEVVLHTITDVSIALEWLHSTFFYIRVKQNPRHYGMPVEDKEIEEKLQQLCLKNLQMLESYSLVNMNDGFILQHTELGRLMARYCVAFESMKRFLTLKGKETLAELVNELSQCKEFEDVRLRVNEKRVLNTLNKDKIKPTIRFQMTGKVKSTDMKVNCLIQATLGCLPVQEFALIQDTQKIFRAASRLSKCLMEVQMIGENFESLFGSVLLHKSIQAKMWENSKFISKQLEKIGLSLSTTLVNAGFSSFEKLHNTSPRELEMIMNKHPPFGNQIRDAVALLPRYKLSLNQVLQSVAADVSELEVTVFLLNHAVLKEKGATWGTDHACILLIGDTGNTVLCKQKISDSQLLNRGQYTRKLVVHRDRRGDELKAHYISLSRVGLDVHETFAPKYITSAKRTPVKPTNQKLLQKMSSSAASSAAGCATLGNRIVEDANYKPCSHKCLNKAVCGHECCKNGIPRKSKSSKLCASTTRAVTAAATPWKSTPGPQSHGATERQPASTPGRQAHRATERQPASTPAGPQAHGATDMRQAVLGGATPRKSTPGSQAYRVTDMRQAVLGGATPRKSTPGSQAYRVTDMRQAVTPRKSTPGSQAHRATDTMSHYVNQLHAKATDLPSTPALNRIKPALSIHNKQQKESLKNRFSYTPKPSMTLSKPSPHRGGQNLPPAVLSHTSATVEENTRAKEDSRDDDFWSSFCGDSETGCTGQQWKGKQSVHYLEELGDYDAEDHFIEEDSIHLDDNYELPSYGSVIYNKKDTKHLSPNYASSSGLYKACHVSNGSHKASHARTSPSFHLSQYVAENSFGTEECKKAASEDLSAMYYNVENQMPSFHKNRKRAIDEMYDIDNEDFNSAKFPLVTPRSSDVDGRANVKKNFTKHSSNHYSSNTEAQENSHAKKTSNFTTPMTARSQVAPLQPTTRQLPPPPPVQEQQPPAQHSKATLQTPAFYGGEESAALAMRRVPCMSLVPATCSSFFTAGAVDPAEDDNENDVFGSVFAGIF